MGKAIIIHNVSFASLNLGKVTFIDNSTYILKITALEDLTLTFSNNLEYNTKSYANWKKYKANTPLSISNGTIVSFRGELTPDSTSGIGTFTSTGEFNVFGSPLALIDGNELDEYAFKYLFKDCTNLISAKDLVLPNTTEAYCYEGMFKGCTSLEEAPILVAQTLSQGCYDEMFYGCTSLDNILCYNISDISDYVNSNWVTGVAVSGKFEIDYNGDWDSTNIASHIPSGWKVNDDYNKPYTEMYFTIDVISGGKFNVLPAREQSTTEFTDSNALTISYSINEADWVETKLLDSGLVLDVEEGDKIRFKGNNTNYCNNKGSNTHKQWYVIFGFINPSLSGTTTSFKQTGITYTTATYNVYGNIMSLCYGDNFASQTELPASYTFCSIFKNSNVVSAEHLVFPATTLLASCYRAMFSFARHLTVSPTLPNITPVSECYKYMFECCDDLRKITCLVPTGLNTNAFTSWCRGTTNISDVILIKHPDTTINSSSRGIANEYVSNAGNPIPEVSSANYAIIGSNWTVVNAEL